jgi:cell wall-associated NlpC family hydrolase
LTFALAAFLFGGTDLPADLAAAATTKHEPLPRALRQAHKRTVGERAAAIALREVGVPYRWGGISPARGFDCSGLVYWTYRRLGIKLPHSSYALYDHGREVPRTRVKPGDVLFFSGLGHVGIYVGRGRMVHAPHTGSRVQVVRLSRYGGQLVGVRRIRGLRTSGRG